jgi:hypothetical protein
LVRKIPKCVTSQYELILHSNPKSTPIFSIVIENSGLAAVHNDLAPRAYKGLIAHGYWGFWYAALVGFWPPFFSVHLDKSKASGPRSYCSQFTRSSDPAFVYSISLINKLYYFISLSDRLTWTTNYLKNHKFWTSNQF